MNHVEELNAPKKFSFIVHIGAVHIGRHRVNNLTVFPDLAPYRRLLTAREIIKGEPLLSKFRTPDMPPSKLGRFDHLG